MSHPSNRGFDAIFCPDTRRDCVWKSCGGCAGKCVMAELEVQERIAADPYAGITINGQAFNDEGH